MDPLHDLCLTCLSKPSISHNLSDVILGNQKILEILKNLIPNLIRNPDIPLPNCICYVCVDKLVNAYKFQRQCLDSIENLSKLWQESFRGKVVKEEIEVYDLHKSNNHEDETLTKENSNENEELHNHEETLLTKEDSNDSLSTIEESLTRDKMDLRANIDDLAIDQDDVSDSFNYSTSASECDKEEEFFKDKLANIKEKKNVVHKDYKCEYCHKVFTTSSYLKQHLICHSNDKPYPCTKCDKAFKHPTSLRQHLERHSNKRPYKCQLCSKTFRCVADYLKHKTLHVKKPFRCKICNKLFLTMESLQKHERIKKHTQHYEHGNEDGNKVEGDDNENSLDAVDEQEFVSNEYTNLDSNETITKVEDVEICEELVINQIEDNEMKEVLNEKQLTEFKNTNDSPEITTESENGNKTNVNKETTMFKCELCNKTFKLAHGLNLHKTTVHLRKHPFNCEMCNKGFMLEEHYIKHRNRHLGIKTFKCKECGKAFDSNSTLNQHLKAHSKETPYLCTICGKSFNRASTLQQHTLRHSDATPYKCSDCDKKFKCYSDLLCHARRHKGKIYECELCGKRLANSTSVKHHKLVHSGDKPFKCDFCDRCFNSTSNLKCHIRIHTGEKPYNCPFCEKTFRQSYDSKKHAKRMHPKEWAAAKMKLKDDEDDENK